MGKQRTAHYAIQAIWDKITFRIASKCRHYFNVDMSDLALPNSHYTHRVVAMAVRLVVEDGLPYRAASWHLWRDHRVFVPYATIQNWVEAGGKKGRAAHPQRVLGRRVG